MQVKAAPKKVSSKATKSKEAKPAPVATKETDTVADKPIVPIVVAPVAEEKKETTSKTAAAKPKSKDAKDAVNGDKPVSAGRGAMKHGSVLPKIVLQNEDGEDVDVSTLAGERGVVFFLYPRVSLRVCCEVLLR